MSRIRFLLAHNPDHNDPWHRVHGEDGPVPHPAAAPHLLLTLEQWHAVRDNWPAGLPVGVELPNDLDVETLAADLPKLSLVAVQFPKWVDGRAYTQARLLRTRLKFQGEIRATGEVLVDMALLLQRTGVDVAVLRADQSIEAAQRTLAFFPGHYQGDTVEPKPHFAQG
ncbi:DUF934 domain-containing protein [Roseateles sp. BYS180W]|uniref:DUF934 domain-containing protein n=1 Tax=Roseateles rivi TaxID=3299028 RepID=A0ABW7FYQ1_9BURK